MFHLLLQIWFSNIWRISTVYHPVHRRNYSMKVQSVSRRSDGGLNQRLLPMMDKKDHMMEKKDHMMEKNQMITETKLQLKEHEICLVS